MQTPSQVHYGAAKRTLRYLQGTIDFGIWYKPTQASSLTGSIDDVKSTSGYAFTLGTEEKNADIFTKALPKPKFDMMRTLIGVTKRH
ncbi:hypothetical protein LIER_38926 [Lithospermum erythrorhizon]|uniref:Uncharacterized protein n=1 Tax=Lithospermum erythrorhizon TaxID=34254 RepID=A0AAV3Q9G7_LITER